VRAAVLGHQTEQIALDFQCRATGAAQPDRPIDEGVAGEAEFIADGQYAVAEGVSLAIAVHRKSVYAAQPIDAGEITAARVVVIFELCACAIPQPHYGVATGARSFQKDIGRIWVGVAPGGAGINRAIVPIDSRVASIVLLEVKDRVPTGIVYRDLVATEPLTRRRSERTRIGVNVAEGLAIVHRECRIPVRSKAV
jgi:hypothetical protein